MQKNSLRFVDLFAGLGGFHVGLRRLGHRCVMACELQSELRDLYERNFCLVPRPDVRLLSEKEIPDHELLCAGFPCQPFSKAGEQLGLGCDKDGDLFAEIVRILRWKRPKLIMLENVANLARHDAGITYKKMKRQLRALGYAIDEKVLSPHLYGIPQIRDRLFIVGAINGLRDFVWPESTGIRPHIRTVLDKAPDDAKPIPDHYTECLEVWQAFLDRFPSSEELPSFPIWSMEFGADYPYVDSTPSQTRALGRYRGSHGIHLKNLPRENRLSGVPSYARSDAFPKWKQDFIRQNRELYQRHHRWLDKWIPKILKFPPSLQKLEWNCKGERRALSEHILQFRASGVRVKRADAAPALIAMTTTQVPIIASQGRYMTVRECSRLQGLGELKHLPQSSTRAYRALGNAVNADLVELIAKHLIAAINGSRIAA